MWKVIDSGKQSASALMEKDKNLLLAMKKEDAPTIHFYEFIKPSFTFGVFVEPQNLMEEKVYRKDFDFSKRPTGGGVLFHQWDFAFSCFVPKSYPKYSEDVMECYKYINLTICKALKEFVKDKEGEFSLLPEEPTPLDEDCKSFCFAKPTKYDIMFNGKKIAGAAQRRKEGGYLHQGSISLLMPDFTLLKPLFKDSSKVLSAMGLYTYPLLGNCATASDRSNATVRIKKNIVNGFEI
jgi:lipoate-protein ligase A